MKCFAIPLLEGMVVYCTQAPAQKLEFKEHSAEESILSSKVENNIPTVLNINGKLRMEGHDGNKVILKFD